MRIANCKLRSENWELPWRALMYLNPLNFLNLLNLIFRGAYAPIAIIVFPWLALMYLNPLNLLNLLNLIFRGAYATFYIIVLPIVLLKISTFSTIFNSQCWILNFQIYHFSTFINCLLHSQLSNDSVTLP